MPRGQVLRLTVDKNPIEIDPFFERFERIRELDKIDATDDALTLYIVGHAIPNELAGPGDKSGLAGIPETDLAKAIRDKRDNKPTLIIWDVCYAKSFKDIGDIRFDSWLPNYVHIFSCQAYERTWVRTQRDANNPQPRISFFSQKLAAALPRHRSWEPLEKDLRAQLGSLQTPEIVEYHPFGVGAFRV